KMPNRLALFRVVLGAIPLGLLFAAYNYAVFQTPMPVGYNYSTNWQTEHQTGFLSLTMPTLDRLYGLTFSPIRGMFLLSPVLLLAFPGWVMMWRERHDQRGVVLVSILVTAGFFLYNAASVMWWGGFTVGPRYLIPMLPFMMLPIIFVFNRLLQRVPGQLLTGFLIAASLLHVGLLTISGQGWPPVSGFPFTIDQMNATFPVFDHSLPLLLNGDVSRNYGGLLLDLNGLSGLIPLLVAAIAIWIIVPRLVARRDQPAQPIQSVRLNA
ncbi:MAG: hypothetical protein K8I30_00200, partial [Anaerolineae bacterium]|nr:hypothetical protein [Anaerolineae bacterium]